MSCSACVLGRVSRGRCPHFKDQNISLCYRIVSTIPNSQVPAFSCFQMYANVLCFQGTVTNCPHLSGGHKDRFHRMLYSVQQGTSFLSSFLAKRS